jgi:hypothetical protein
LDRYSKGRGFDPHHGQANFSACSVWMLRVTSQTIYFVTL